MQQKTITLRPHATKYGLSRHNACLSHSTKTCRPTQKALAGRDFPIAEETDYLLRMPICVLAAETLLPAETFL